jgi:predicted GNAT family N-acyltransferase
MPDEIEIVHIKVGSEYYKRIKQLRFEILFKPFGAVILEFKKDDELDLESYHIGAILNDEVVGYCRLSGDKKDMHISRVFVVGKLEKKGIGSKLICEALQVSKINSVRQVNLNSRIEAVKFYERFGFVAVGNSFISEFSGVELMRMINVLI